MTAHDWKPHAIAPLVVQCARCGCVKGTEPGQWVVYRSLKSSGVDGRPGLDDGVVVLHLEVTEDCDLEVVIGIMES